MDGYRADVPALQRHAKAVRDHGDRLGEVAAAADHPLAPNAYGLICGFLSGMTNEAEGRLRGSIGTLAALAGSHAAGLAGCADDYQRQETQVATRFGGGAR
ncbi:hypothetical protein [Pseudonocardia acaciae]|uniref:hypothetical protein n=1 Tax=Pseudonocardia acaciae TaxID=551276 RepID=UPI00048BA363|nr:hypothetical protein [Pseudonocardia acaciae]